MNIIGQSVQFPVAELLVALLLACVIWLRLSPVRIDRARLLVVATLTTSMLILGWAASWLYALGDGYAFEGLFYIGAGAGVASASTHLLGVDALAASFGLMGLGVALVAVLAAERARLSVSALERLVLAAGANLLIVFSRSLWLVVVGLWLVAVFLPTLKPGRTQKTNVARMPRVFLGLGALALTAATIFIAARVGAWALIPGLELDGLSQSSRWIVLALILVAIVAREGVFPLHGWFVPLAARDAAFGAAVTLLPHVGVYLVIRVFIPAFPDELDTVLPVLSGLAAASALLLALRVAVQRSLGRAVALLVLSQSALILVGLETMNLEGVAGGLMALTASSAAGVALLATTSFAIARMGDPNLRTFMGLGANTPRLSAAFLVFGLAMVAFPGTVGFVGEDLLFHGAFEASVPAALAVILAAALNGYMVLFLFARGFLGPGKPSAWMKDLMPLELTVVVVGLVFVIGFGLMPQPLLNSHEPLAQEIAGGHEVHLDAGAK